MPLSAQCAGQPGLFTTRAGLRFRATGDAGKMPAPLCTFTARQAGASGRLRSRTPKHNVGLAPRVSYTQ